MLTFFPSLYEDELLYSVFARYHKRSGNLYPKHTSLDLFDKQSRPYPHVIRNLSNIIEKVPHFDKDLLRSWIENHTLYYYYTNFAREGTKGKLFSLMADGEQNGLINVGIENHTFFRHCPICVVEDIKRYGETYWHKSHQLVGTFFCLKHNEILKDSKVLLNPNSKGNNTLLFEAASLTNCHFQQQNEIKRKFYDHLYRITKEAIKVSNTDLKLDYDETSRIYRFLLYREGYMNGEQVNNKKLYKDFLQFYGAELLEFLGVSFDFTKRSNWLASIVKKHTQVFHPVKHILLTIFLRETVDNLKSYLGEKYLPFGSGPYICLNPFSDHYLERVIPHVRLIANHGEQPMGLFKCKCGIQFTRISEKKECEIHQIKFVDERWIDSFNELRKQKLTSNDKLHKIKFAYINYQSGLKLKYKPLDEVINKYRNDWLTLCLSNPNLSTDRLKRKEVSLYSFLRRHDKQWLENNSPNIKSVGKKVVDWGSRDIEVHVKVKEAVKRILAKTKLTRVTIPAIKREIDPPVNLDSRALQRMPKTNSYLY